MRLGFVPVFARLALAFPAAALASSLSAGSVVAQSGAVAGTVVDSRTGRPLADAAVAVEGGTARVRTNARGEFRFESLSGTVQLQVSRIGYRPRTATAAAGTTTVRVELDELAVKLDELVVTGTAAEQTKRSMGNVVGQVSVADIVQIAPPTKIQDMLSVNVPGVRVIRSGGAVGGGGPTRIRGSGSLSLSNEPLIYIDGVRINNDAAANTEAFFNWSYPSRINDLNPEEIESIEILKGPSAATIYGTEASNGVIQVITKRGRAGRPTWELHADAGANWLQNPEGRFEPNYYVGRDGKVKEFRVLDFQKEICLDPARNCPTHVFSTGTPFAAGLTLSGGTEALRYFFSIDANRDEGYLHYNWQNKYNARANLSYSSRDDKFKVDLSFGGVRSKTRSAEAFQAVTTSIIWSCNFPGCEPDPSDPDNTGWNGPGHGFQFYRPEDYDAAFGFDFIDRTMFSMKFSHRPLPWLRHQLTVGPDFTTNRSSNLIERDGSGYNPFFDWSLGYKTGRTMRSTFLTLDYGAAADWSISKSLTSTTSVGAQYYYKQYDILRGEGRRFSIPGGSDITGASQRVAEESFFENKNIGIYAQQQFALKNRLFLTGAVRGDDNSAFGSNFDAVIYPKVSASWVLSDEPFMPKTGFISQLKLRGAWGRAGLAPDVFSAIRTYQPKVGPAGQGGVSPQNLGNPNLKPEVGEEIELGIDAGLFNQRLGVEFTFYNKDVKDAIVSVPNKPSRGFPGVSFVNLGKTRNRGIELALDGTVINQANLGLDLRGTIATNSNTILDMGDLNPLVGGIIGNQWDVEGFPAGSIFSKKVVGSSIQRIPVGAIQLPIGFDPMCEGGTDLGYGNGTQVPCESAPRIFQGRVTPAWNGSLSATLTINKRLRVLGLVDYLGGHYITCGDCWAMHAFFLSSREILEGTDPILSGYLGTFLLQGDPNSVANTGLFKAGFAKLRTVSVSYDLPNRLTRWVGAARGSITISGENLVTLWRAQKEAFGVSWIDSEISSNAPWAGVRDQGFIQESFPQAARVRATMRFSF
ncbi:MAG: SusC/RagA family TonB-linked outer membrane protein [Gemmatimonadetes bacterium]|nr:SusC/RagA family TonB-linked outer membrane protein [Gemmatimonadota bacterium]